jgi:cytochrome c oxidase cbb3-type subunit 3
MNEHRDDDRLLDHEYDGIREYDNPLPRWWLWIFWVSIAWSAVYLVNVIPGVGSGAGREKQYAAEMAAARAKYGDPKAALATVDDATILAAEADPARLAAGRATFMTNCVACHRDDAGGNIGPNLTDEYWIHGGKPSQIHSTISGGVLDKGMPSWSAILKPDEILSVAAYVQSLKGSHPKDPKEPQGVKMEDESHEGAKDAHPESESH